MSRYLSRAAGKITLLAAGFALTVSGCDRASGPATPPAAVGTAAEPATPPVAREAAAPSFVTQSRKLVRDELGGSYCLVRHIKDSQGNILSTMKVPIIGVPRGEDWATIKDIKLERIPDESNCPSNNIEFSGQTLKVVDSGRDTFGVSILQGESDAKLTATFTRPAPEVSPHRDAFLTADNRCEAGDNTCGAHDRYDAYLYVVDVAMETDPEVPKLVLIDLFEPVDPSNACGDERLEHAVEPRTSDCTLPGWIPKLFGTPQGTVIATSAATPPVGAEPKQTGTGGGYEPP
jgi:hypothetical protein